MERYLNFMFLTFFNIMAFQDAQNIMEQTYCHFYDKSNKQSSQML